MIPEFDFYQPHFLWLLLIIPLLITNYIFRILKKPVSIQFASANFLPKGNSNKVYLKHALFGLQMISLALLILAFARPQSSSSWQNVNTEGIDIVIALDVSGSMLAEDFSPNRLEAAKAVAIEFIKNRPNDRIGLVLYAGESFTQCPITSDHTVLINLFEDVKHNMIQDGTAIGNGLATSVNRLKESSAKSKVVILLSDGDNNAGHIPPMTASEIAKTFDVRVYTIAVGSKGMAPFPFKNPFGGISYQNIEVKIDETTLRNIAEQTDGKFFRATDNKSLQSIYEEIDQLETSKIEVTEFRKKYEEFLPLALLALGLIVFDFIMRLLFLKGVV